MVSKGQWTDENTLSFVQRWPEEGWTVNYQLRFDGRRVQITQVDQYGRKRTLEGERSD